jgi:hypothetical protein
MLRLIVSTRAGCRRSNNVKTSRVLVSVTRAISNRIEPLKSIRAANQWPTESRFEQQHSDIELTSEWNGPSARLAQSSDLESPFEYDAGPLHAAVESLARDAHFRRGLGDDSARFPERVFDHRSIRIGSVGT